MKRILFQGDSITSWFQNQERANVLGSNYVTMVAGELSLKYPQKYEFINRSVSGDRITDILSRVQKHIVALRPDYLSILVGVNDVGHAFEQQNGVSAERYEIYYDLLISEIRESLPELQIMILEPFILPGTITKEQWESFRSEVEKRAAAAKRIAEKNNLLFVPLQKKFDDALMLAPAEYWLDDGVHPTPAGHQIIKNAWIEAFNETV